MTILNREDLAWAAGFFDGECNFFSQQKKGHTRFIIQIGQKYPQVLENLVRIFPFSRITGPYEHRGKYRFPKKSQPMYYRWSVQDFEHAQYVVACVWPWLGEVKKEQIKSALGFLRTQRNTFSCNVHNNFKIDRRGNPYCRSCRSEQTDKSWVTRRRKLP